MANVECKLKEIMGEIRKPSLYKIVLQQVLTFTFRLKNNTIPSALQKKVPIKTT